MSDQQTTNEPGPPAARPDRRTMLLQMLAGTKRGAVPIRSAFIQKPRTAGPRRGNMLEVFARNERAVDAYLLIHAMASASSPYDAKWPIETWVQVARFDEAAELHSAKAAWSRAARLLREQKLIGKVRRRNYVDYHLLNESGDGRPYIRPKTESDGTWFSLPHIYWTEGFDNSLTWSEKRVLLVALDQKDGFNIPVARMPQWYGISATAAQEGYTGLVRRGILSASTEYEASPKSPTGWREVKRYTVLAPWSRESHRTATESQVTFIASEDDNE